MKKEGMIDKKRMKKYLEEKIKENSKEGVLLLNLGCFYDIGCNIERCRTNCERYENDNCKIPVESIWKDYSH